MLQYSSDESHDEVSMVGNIGVVRLAVRMRDEMVPIWGSKKINQLLIMMPLIKFGMGCVSYLFSVVLLSFRDLESKPGFQIACLVIGIISMSTVFMTVAWVHGPDLIEACRPGKPRKVVPHHK